MSAHRFMFESFISISLPPFSQCYAKWHAKILVLKLVLELFFLYKIYNAIILMGAVRLGVSIYNWIIVFFLLSLFVNCTNEIENKMACRIRWIIKILKCLLSTFFTQNHVYVLKSVKCIKHIDQAVLPTKNCDPPIHQQKLVLLLSIQTNECCPVVILCAYSIENYNQCNNTFYP